MFRLWLCFITLALGGAAKALESNPLVRSWQTEDGLPSNTIRWITQTTDGFMWLGTEAGLARFDGSKFVTFGPREGLPAVAVSALTAARDGALWVGYWRYGLFRLQNNEFTSFTTANGLPSNTIRSISEGTDGTLWIGTSGGLARWTGKDFAAVPNPPNLSDMQAILARRDGVVWVNFAPRTLRIWNGREWQEPAAPPPGELARLTSLAEDPQGALWAVSNDGPVLRFDENGWEQFPLLRPPDKTNARPVAISSSGEVCVGHMGAGLWRLKGKTFEPLGANDGSGEALVEGLYFDRLGQLWVGSFSSGLLRLSPRQVESIRLDRETNADPVRALIEAKPGEMWIGTQSRGTWRRVNGVNERLDLDPGIHPENFSNAIVRSHDGDILVASTVLRQYVDGQLTATLDLPQKKEAIASLAAGADAVFAGTASGRILKWQKGRLDVFAEPQGSGVVWSVAITADQTVWASTWGRGVRRIRAGEDTFLTMADGLRSNVVNALYVDVQDTVWVGTQSGGLSRWSDGRFQTIGREEGLLDDTINQIIEDGEGQLWLGGLRGLSVVPKAELEEVFAGRAMRVHPRSFGKTDGMDSSEFLEMRPIQDSSGRLCFGTSRGFVRVDPRRVESGEEHPRVHVENLTVDGQNRFSAFDSTAPPSIELAPGVSRIDVGYTAPQFITPEQIRFRYRLAGGDSPWHEVGNQRTVSFNRLPPGRYRFEVVAATPGGAWSSPAPLFFTLRPYYWQTGWFLACCILVALIIVGVAVWAVMRQRAARKMERLEKQHAVDAERARIAQDLHDDLGASLTEIALYSDLAKTDLASPDEASEHLEHIFVTARNSTRALDEIIWAANPKNDSLENFAAFVSKQAQDLAHAAGMSCHLDVPNPLPAIELPATVRHHLFLATREALHNAAKHSGAQKLSLRLAVEDQALCLIIEDDGRGFSEAPHDADADGLVNMKRRMSAAGGDVQIDTSSDHGTKVIFRVPVVEPFPVSRPRSA